MEEFDPEEHKRKVQEERMQYAKSEIEKLGFRTNQIDETCLEFIHKEAIVKLFPFTGWHTGKSINDGRGIKELLKQLK